MIGWRKIQHGPEHLGPLRQFMSGDPDGLEVFAIEADDPKLLAERSLFAVACAVAVRRRFGVPGDRSEIIQFIADLRVALDKDVDDLDPYITEHWIRGVLGQYGPDERGPVYEHPEEVIQAAIYVLARLRNQGIVGDGGLEDFLEETLALAERSQETFLEELAESRGDGEPPMPPVQVVFDR
jgi:hypothetical protein